MTDKEAMKQALKALELEDMACRYEKESTPEHIANAITSLRQAIEQNEKQEPVAWADYGVLNWIADMQFKHASYLYTHPPQRTEPICPECKAEVLYECVACGSNNYPPKRTEQEPVVDSLYFAQWTASKKNLSDYICVGSLTLAGIEDGEYGQSEADLLDNTIDALQEKLITGPHKKVPLLAYIGGLNTTPSPRTWVGLTDEDMPTNELDAFCRGARWADTKLKEKNT